MTAAALDYGRLRDLLDLDPADTLAEQVRLLQERRAELLDQLDAIAYTTRRSRQLVDLAAACREEQAVVEDALRAVGASLVAEAAEA